MSSRWTDPRVLDGLARQFTARDAGLDAGARRLGWKVGFGAPASLELMGIDAPLVGYLTDATLRPSGAAIDVTGWKGAVVEFELAVYVVKDIAPDASEATVLSSVGALCPSIEVANVDLPVGPDSVGDILASNIFHRAVVLGEADASRRGLDTTGLEARIVIDGAEFARTSQLEAMTGKHSEIVSTVAATVATQGDVLRAGDVIITGSVLPPLRVTESAVFEFVLDPLPPIWIELTVGTGR